MAVKSWVIIRKSDGKVIAETFNSATVERLNKDKFEAVDIKKYLSRLNSKIKSEANPFPPITKGD